jgi:hypothetical protein
MTAADNFGEGRESRRRMRMSPLFAWRSGTREEFEVKDDRAAVAAAGGALRASLSSNSCRAELPTSNQWSAGAEASAGLSRVQTSPRNLTLSAGVRGPFKAASQNSQQRFAAAKRLMFVGSLRVSNVLIFDVYRAELRRHRVSLPKNMLHIRWTIPR